MKSLLLFLGLLGAMTVTLDSCKNPSSSDVPPVSQNAYWQNPGTYNVTLACKNTVPYDIQVTDEIHIQHVSYAVNGESVTFMVTTTNSFQPDSAHVSLGIYC